MKVLIPTLGSRQWLGGVHYTRNLVLSSRLADPTVQFIHWGQIENSLYEGHSPFQSELAPQIERFTPRWLKKNLSKRLAVLPRRWLRLSHDEFSKFDVKFNVLDSLTEGKPLISWIADFQHIDLPDYFSAEARAERDSVFERQARESNLIVLSSEHARSTFDRLFPFARDRARVLQFVPRIESLPSAEETIAALKRYAIDRAYLILPNQFWVHKNHRVVLEALALLKARSSESVPLVVMTGTTQDPRHAGHFETLTQFIREKGLEECVRVLGVVPLSDLRALTLAASALINPSRFEGWSTTVEEAKAVHKPMLLSDIPVHREQAPTATFFGIDKPTELADVLMQVQLTAPEVLAKGINRETILSENTEMAKKFGRTFLRYVNEAVGGTTNKFKAGAR